MSVHEPISPELVLVDPELRRRLLDAELRDLLQMAVLASRPQPPARESERAPERAIVFRTQRRRRHDLPQIAIAAVLATAVLGLPSLAFLPPRQQPTLAPTAAVSSASRPRIDWKGESAADYYVVEFLVDGRLAAVVTPSDPAAAIPASLVGRAATWHVFAGYGPVSQLNTHGPIASGSIAPGNGA